MDLERYEVGRSGRLTTEEWNRINAFLGYGRRDAPVWFLGMEEAGGGEDELRIRAGFNQVEDCAEAHRKLGITKHHSGKCVIQPTWGKMSELMLRLSDEPSNRESKRRYQVQQLGRGHGKTFLTELLPLPKPAIEKWGYEEEALGFSHSEYYEITLDKRVLLLTKTAQENKPILVIAYGKAYWHHYQKIWPLIDFYALGQFEVGQNRDTLVVLTHHLTARSMNNGVLQAVEIVKRRIDVTDLMR